MLMLTRRSGESILIDRGNKVRIGIEAPRDVEILREELLDDGEHLG